MLNLCYYSLRVFAVFTPTPYLPNAEGKRGGFCPWGRDADSINRCWLALQGGNRISNWGVCECWFCLRIFVPTPFPVVCFCASASFQRLLPQWWEGRDWTVANARTGNSFLLEDPVFCAGNNALSSGELKHQVVSPACASHFLLALMRYWSWWTWCPDVGE